MLWSFQSLRRYGLRATDGTLGSVSDVYFDDETWTVRWLVVDTGWLFGRRVLLSPAVLGHPDAGAQEFPVDLSRETIREAPGIDVDKPVSRQHETELYGYYGWFPYWGGDAWGAPAHPPETAAAEARRSREATRLRSGSEIVGYHVREADDSVGEVEDLLLQEDGWKIRYLVVDTGTWLPGRSVLIAPTWVHGVSWNERAVTVGLTRAEVEASPPYERGRTVSRDYETMLHRHFRQTPYWE